MQDAHDQKHIDNFLSHIASQAVSQSDLSLEKLDDLANMLNFIVNSDEDRKNKTFIQRVLVSVFAFNNVALFYLMVSQASKHLLFFNLKLEENLSYYIYIGMFLTYYLLAIIVKYHFPEQKGLLEKIWDKIFNRRSQKVELKFNEEEAPQKNLLV